MTYVKICGITNVEDARCATAAGADLLGFIFYPPSPRYLVPARAGEIVRAIRDETGDDAPRMVGVFVDAPGADVAEAAATAGLDLIQLHGAEPPDMVQQLPHAFKALRSRTLSEAEDAVTTYRSCFGDDPTVPDLLIDAYHPREHGGTGLPADAAAARALARRCRLLLAGGLTPDNVSDAIALIQPWGVDVSSGVERAKGLKDHALVRAFVAAVRATKTLPCQDTMEAL